MCWSARSALFALSFLVVLGPLIFRAALAYAPWIEPLQAPLQCRAFRRSAAVSGRRAGHSAHVAAGGTAAARHSLRPGIAATLVLWLAFGFAFGRYLADFAYTYVTYYAGLASAMMALVFLYYSAWIFVYGGELNAAIVRAREDKA